VCVCVCACVRVRLGVTYVADQLSNHSIPGAVVFPGAISSVFYLPNLVVETDKLGNFFRKVDAESFIHLELVAVFVGSCFHCQVRFALTQKHQNEYCRPYV